MRKTKPGEHEPEPLGQVHRLGPHHARGLERLAGLTVSTRQGDAFDFFHLDVELNCGDARIDLPDGPATLTLRLCHVDLRRANCSHIAKRRYETYVRADQARIVAETSRAKTGKVSGEMSVEVGARASGLLGRIGAKALASREAATTEREASRFVRKIDLIRTDGPDRWQVGHPRHGDARRDDGRLAGSYFGEDREKNGEPKPLCVLRRDRGREAVEVILRASAPISQLVLDPGDAGLPPHVRGGMTNDLRRKGAQALKAHEKALIELRCRIAGMVAAKDLQARAGDRLGAAPDDAILIGVAGLVLPASEGGGRR